ncbi:MULTISPECIES: TonB-dependent siderophore receptor [unclassified Sinorhizobium]|uniref:TonB-dependent siderophore receptor n=1 Tax=unclassified Sinorhizobium TaxID=2613772 RepID=UPI0024C3E3A7|nr:MULTISPECIES: TonB-dependent siderophore receptor [unclassified Sinorhizobium]MDK1375076.1 TonB-dependent siderophore receptor [Sinorhizobium sp. 6-70]MDK1481662.1 TonB-dependent siderophore receptor [Sinorhizobium sp. 6-117]
MQSNGNRVRLKDVLGGGVAFAALLVAGAAPAQDGSATQLERLVVEGGASANGSATGPVDGYVAKATSTGSKSATPVTAIPQSVSVVGREELDDRGVVNKIDEALRYTPGVATEPFGTDADTDWFYIRGFNATQTGVFLDGLSLYSFGFGGFQIDPFMLERVEVLKGPASVLYGGANPGGIINLISKRPLDEPFHYAEIGINNDGNAFTGFDLNDSLNEDGTVRYRLTGEVAGGDNYSDFSEDLRGFVLPQIAYAPDDATSLTVYGLLQGLDQLHVGNGFLPYVGTVVDAPFGKIDRDAFYGEPDLDEGTYAQQMIGYEAKHELESGWTFTQNARYAHLHKHEQGPYTFGYVGGTPTGPDYLLNRIGFEATSKVDSFAIDNRVENEFDLGGTNHALLAGLDYKYYRLDHIQACCGATPISATDPVYGVPQGPNFVYLNQVVTQQQLGVYAQDQIRFGDGWLVTLNGRYDYVDTDIKNGTTAFSSPSNFSYDDGALSGRAGLAYEFENGITPYVSIATFFNPLIGNRDANPDPAVVTLVPLKPEEGYQYEAGIKYAPTFIDGLFTASVFEITKQNVQVTDILGLSTQFGEVRARGIELEAKVNVDENWQLISAFSYTDLEITEDTNPSLIGKTPYIVPETQAAVWLDYTLTSGVLEGMSLGAGVRYQGESWADAENTKKVPDATLVDAAIRYEKNDWAASLNVANLFDKEYVKGCQGLETCGYGEGRTITLKLSKTW